MHIASLLLSAVLAFAKSDILRPGIPVAYAGELVPRRLFDNISECTTLDTCAECFGWGYRLCDDAGCFNPDDGEQCCKGGDMCVGLDSSCCENGAGKAGKDGVVPYSSRPIDDEDEDEDEDAGSSWYCTASMTGEECCSEGGADIHWCSGAFPSNMCYNSTQQTCCVDGHICSEEDCCDIVDSKPTTPWLSETTAQSTSTTQSTSTAQSSSTATSASESESGDTESSTTTTPSSVDADSSTPTDAGEKLAIMKGTTALFIALAVGSLVL
ncbi:hypothetical protein BJX99DRAFT_171077 [Aspergillus californicus]